MGLKKIIVIAGVLALAFSVGAFMNLFSGFTVEREVIVGPEKFSEPGNLVKASDGGYFVIGSETGIAWATKTDADGKVLWTVEEPAPAGTAAHFLTAAASSDGGVLLCGRRDGFVEKATGRATGRAGLILRLDKDGHEINRIDPYLKDPENIDRLIGTFACSNWGDGFMVSGGARVADKSANGSPVTHGFPTILRLNGNGTLLWQKNMDGDFNKPLPQSNGDIIFLGAHGEDDGDKGFLTRIDRDGNILKVVKYPSSLIDLASRWVGSSDQDRGLQILSYPANIAAILEIGPDLQITKKVEFDLPDGMGVSKAYKLPDGTMIMSGAEHGTIHSRIPVLIALRPDLSVRAKHEFLGGNEFHIVDFLPTVKRDEFVTLRFVWDGEKGNAAMTFLKLSNDGNN